jgi:hypothetical protein
MLSVRPMKLPALTFSILLWLAFGCSPAFATIFRVVPWRTLVSEADFVGVIECTVAGGIVARYQVVDSWKGVANGEQLTVRIPVDPFGPQFPTVLCGQRFVVVAFRDQGFIPPENITPLGWRRLHADYGVPQMAEVREGQLIERLNPFTMDATSLDIFKRQAVDFIGKPAEEQEKIRLLNGGALRLPTNADPSQEARLEAIPASVSAKEAAQGILQMATQADERTRQHLLDHLGDGGGLATLEVLEQMEPGAWSWQKHDLERTKESIKVRAGLLPRRGYAAPKDWIPTPDQIEQAREELRQPRDRVPWAAVRIMSPRDPARVVEMLLQWQPKESVSPASDVGYYLGSQFVHLCGRDREMHLTALLKACDPWIKTAAAVYLCFENPALGKTSLKDMCSLEGGPGGWAALVLASRGDKSAVPRALELYKASQDRHDMEKRLRVLLSNSARHSGLQQPPLLGGSPDSETLEAAHLRRFEEVKKWWDESLDKIILFDPWLEALDKQKVD